MIDRSSAIEFMPGTDEPAPALVTVVSRRFDEGETTE